VRLLFINYEFPPVGGGASVSSAALAERLVARGHRVDVLTSRANGQAATDEIRGVRIHRVRSWRHGIHECGVRGAASFAGFALPRLERLLGRNHYDLVHCYFGLPCGPLGLYARGRRNLPYVLSMRGSDVPGYDTTDRWLGVMHRLAAPLTRRVLSAASAVVPNSHSLRSLVQAFHPEVECDVIPSSSVENSSASDSQRSPGASARLLCVSRLIPRKNIAVLLHAMTHVRDLDAHLDIVGTGKDAAHLAGLVRELSLESTVSLLGARPHEQVLALYRRSDLFVLPAVAESCSMAMLEAMGSGLPIVTTRVGGNVDLVRHGENGLLVPPGDAGSLASALRTLIGDPDRMRLMGRESRRRVGAEFNPDLHAARYEEVYHRAVRSASRR
jgi:glycosyltransferase involved in cell wall biosynthesis